MFSSKRRQEEENEEERRKISFHHKSWRDNAIDAIVSANDELVATFDRDIKDEIASGHLSQGNQHHDAYRDKSGKKS